MTFHYHLGRNVPGAVPDVSSPVTGYVKYDNVRAAWRQVTETAINTAAEEGALVPGQEEWLRFNLDHYAGDTIEMVNGHIMIVSGVSYWFLLCNREANGCTLRDHDEPDRVSVAGYIKNAFKVARELQICAQHRKDGKMFLTVAQIHRFGRMESSGEVSTSAIAARLNALLHPAPPVRPDIEPIEGVEPGYRPNFTALGAWG